MSDTDTQNRTSQEDDSGDTSSEDGVLKKNWLEWTVSLSGAAIVLFVIGFLVYQYGWGSDEPAELVIELGTPSPRETTVEIPVTVKNIGDQVASAAIIEVCAGPSGCAQLSFDYVPFSSTQTGTVGLRAPLVGPLETRVVSYRNP